MTHSKYEVEVRNKIIELRKLLNLRYSIDFSPAEEFNRYDDISNLIDLAADKIL